MTLPTLPGLWGLAQTQGWLLYKWKSRGRGAAREGGEDAESQTAGKDGLTSSEQHLRLRHTSLQRWSVSSSYFRCSSTFFPSVPACFFPPLLPLKWAPGCCNGAIVFFFLLAVLTYKTFWGFYNLLGLTYSEVLRVSSLLVFFLFFFIATVNHSMSTLFSFIACVFQRCVQHRFFQLGLPQRGLDWEQE